MENTTNLVEIMNLKINRQSEIAKNADKGSVFIYP